MNIFLVMLIITFFIYFICEIFIKKNTVFLTIVGAVLATVSGLRSEIVGTDTLQFYNAFRIIKDNQYGWFESSKTRYEVGYFWLNKIINIFTDEPQIFIFLTSIIIIIGIFYFIYKNSSNVLYSVILYQTMYYFCNSMNLSRQYIAVAIAINSYSYIKQKKIIKACTLVIIGGLFHTSAFLMLPVIIALYKININRKNFLKVLAIITLSIFSIPFIIKVVIMIFPRYEFYLTYSSSFNGGKFMPLIYLIMILGGYLLISKINKNTEKYDEFYFISTYVYIGVALLLIANLYFESASRLTNYFLIYFIIFVPELFKIFDKKSRFILYIMFSMFSILYYLYLLKIGVAGVYPFTFYWQ